MARRRRRRRAALRLMRTSPTASRPPSGRRCRPTRRRTRLPTSSSTPRARPRSSAWRKMQADKKKNAAANKLKYPKGAAQVVGVKEYLEDLAKKQTFFRDAAGNSRVGDTGHKWAKVRFGE